MPTANCQLSKLPTANCTLRTALTNLVIDIGNSRTKVGIFSGGQLGERQVFDGEAWAQILETATNHRPQNIILSTVGSAPAPAWRADMEQIGAYRELDATTPLPFRNEYRTPSTLGKDRVAAVAGALALYPGENCLVVDAGTCITADLLTADGRYLGGNISPGVRMRLRAMHTMTARLPLVETGEVEGLLGESTETALRNGGQLGAALELEGLIDRLEATFGPPRCILTGGDAGLLVKLLKKKIFVHPELVLYGLNKIIDANA